MLKEGTDYESVTLKWCTPRGCSAAEMHNCTAMYRVTPVDVNSRPSSCLINFLLNGRSVMLEMIRRGGGKMISHLLAAHGGEIFIHSLATGRSILEDPPSISEGCGGRVTDYRITYMEPLLSLMLKESLTDDEVVECKQCIYTLMTLESKHEPLAINLPPIGHRGKGPKREEQYRIMWNELETYLRSHLHSDQHSRVLHCLLECRNKDIDDKNHVELDQALRELDHFPKDGSSSSRSGTPTLGGGDGTHRASVIRATTDSPMSPPPLMQPNNRGRHRTLLEIFVARQKAEDAKNKRPEFYGRQHPNRTLPGGGSIYELYPNLKVDASSSTRDAGPAVVE
ncbi:hypothetical protein LSTR_LSTR007029 [Laodelphax striatellus]|uniref:Protein asunder n=1 Tax=Laodelphax striatellus TaxID=195883 RepID=A0A482WKD1_LAOST|nr:hypothetical protein LSTR_LSTR007029 [Laodelphax striatellus]